ncbi:MAG TPA: hypothetical protein VGC38_00285, partial [Pseudolabrys sp.]
ALAGCSAGPWSDQMPQSLGGLPADAPARPLSPYQYPAVHDMPPPRATKPMNDEEQFKLEKELSAIRDRQLSQEGQKPAKAPKVQKTQRALEAPASQAAAGAIAVPPTRQKAAPLPERAPASAPASLPNNAILVPPAGVKANP